jgi:hypothetical protein
VSRCAAGDLTSGTAIESAGRTAPAAHGDCMRESVSDSQRATGGERGAGGLHGDACSLVPRNACPSPSSVRAGRPAVLDSAGGAEVLSLWHLCWQRVRVAS